MYCGLADLTIYLHREIYNYCHALLGMPRYYGPPRVVHATAESYKVNSTTVYQTLRPTKQQVM